MLSHWQGKALYRWGAGITIHFCQLPWENLAPVYGNDSWPYIMIGTATDSKHLLTWQLWNTSKVWQNYLLTVRNKLLNLNLNLKKCLLDKKQIQAGSNVINDTYSVFYVGRPLQRRWAHRWRKSHPNILQCMNRHRAHEVLTFWEHEFGICNQNESTPLGNAPSRHTRGTKLT